MNDHIHCIQDGADAVGSKISDIAFDSYCYISNTFTLPKILTENFEEFDAPYPGIGPIGFNDRKVINVQKQHKTNLAQKIYLDLVQNTLKIILSL